MAEEKISPAPILEPTLKPQPFAKPAPIPKIPFKLVGGRLKIILLAVLGLVMVGSLVFAAYRFGQKKNQSGAQPTPTLIATPTPDPTANWQTYTNTKYGFEVKYNPDLKPTERSGGSETVGQFTYLQTISFGTGANYIKSPYGYEVEVNKKSLIDYRTEIIGHIADKIDSEKEIVFNDNSWTKITYKIFLTTDYVSVTKAVINHNEYGYAITASAMDIDQILSTFKFLEEENQETGEEEIFCDEPRPEVCTMECISPPPYICGSNGKLYCNKCVACADWAVDWYVVQNEPCK